MHSCNLPDNIAYVLPGRCPHSYGLVIICECEHIFEGLQLPLPLVDLREDEGIIRLFLHPVMIAPHGSEQVPCVVPGNPVKQGEFPVV